VTTRQISSATSTDRRWRTGAPRDMASDASRWTLAGGARRFVRLALAIGTTLGGSLWGAPCQGQTRETTSPCYTVDAQQEFTLDGVLSWRDMRYDESPERHTYLNLHLQPAACVVMDQADGSREILADVQVTFTGRLSRASQVRRHLGHRVRIRGLLLSSFTRSHHTAVILVSGAVERSWPQR
jgi:hypothetical protein